MVTERGRFVDTKNGSTQLSAQGRSLFFLVMTALPARRLSRSSGGRHVVVCKSEFDQ
jgi:hypothetical protein